MLLSSTAKSFFLNLPECKDYLQSFNLKGWHIKVIEKFMRKDEVIKF